MAVEYAKDQPVGFQNRVVDIAIVGAGGQIGQYLVKHLIAGGNHRITALVRAESKSELPNEVTRKEVDFTDELGLVNALEGQQALIITWSVRAAQEAQKTLIKAAAEANVQWIMPNHYGIDIANKGISEDTLLGPSIHENIELIETLKKSSWVSLACNFWYEYCLTIGTEAFGIDWTQRKATLYDDGNQKICTTTWDQCGRAVCRLFTLKILPEDANDQSPTLSEWQNRFLYINSFVVSQRDMLASVNRVTGTKEEEFKIEHRSLPDFYEKALADVKAGNRRSAYQVMFSRIFFKEGGGDYSEKVVNDRLGLPKEDLDTATKTAIGWLEEGVPWVLGGDRG